MTPTDPSSPAPDRAVADVLSEGRELRNQAETWARGYNTGRAAHYPWVSWLDEHAELLLDALADALSQPVAQPEGLVTIDGKRYEVEPDPLASWGDGSLWLRARLAPPLPGEPRQEGGGG